MRLLVTPTFERTVKKLHRQQKIALDQAVRAVASQPELGEAKVGDLTGVRVVTAQVPLLKNDLTSIREDRPH